VIFINEGFYLKGKTLLFFSFPISSLNQSKQNQNSKIKKEKFQQFYHYKVT